MLPSNVLGYPSPAAATDAHDKNPAAHWFTAPLSLVKAYPRNAGFRDRATYFTGSGSAPATQPEGLRASTGSTANSVSIVGQEAGFGAMNPSAYEDSISVPASGMFAFELSIRATISSAGTGRLSLGKYAGGDGIGRRAPSFGFEFQPGQVRLFWKTGTGEGESAWFPLEDSMTMRLGVFKNGASLAMYCCGELLATVTSDSAIQIGYDRGFAVEVANGATAEDMQLFAGYCQFSVP